MTIRTLCVDDDSFVLDTLEMFLTSQGHQVLTALSCQEALQHLENAPPFTFCICDYRMPIMYGDEFLKVVAQKTPETIRVLISGFSDSGRIRQALHNGICNSFIEKPFHLSNLISTLNTLLESLR
jgi:two-component system response regulator HupR/HoxA